MNKKKMILTSLASVAVLGAAFVASQPSVVKADDSNTATTQPAGETGVAATPKSEVTSPEIKQAEADVKKAEDKKELPNTGGKDNVAIASLGFLGLLLGALPFVKRKN